MGHKTLHRKQMIRNPTHLKKKKKKKRKKKDFYRVYNTNHKAMAMLGSPYFVVYVYNCFLYEGFS